jgi:hypothetical protein
MFTADNFRRIFDSENRKGFDLASRFFPTLEPLTSAVKDKVKELRQLRAQQAALSPDQFSQQAAALKKELADLKAHKSSSIDDELEAVSLKVLLDTILKRRINKLNVGRLKKRLKPYKFETGFEERRFHNFSARELQTIVEAWKHV